MNFSAATEQLSKLGMTQEKMASALGVSRASVKAARLDPSSPNYRRAPENWRAKLTKAAREWSESLAEFISLLDEFEFEHDGRLFRCRPTGGAIASVSIGGRARSSNAAWDVLVNGASIGTIDANPDETEQTIHDAAIKLAEKLEE